MEKWLASWPRRWDIKVPASLKKRADSLNAVSTFSGEDHSVPNVLSRKMEACMLKNVLEIENFGTIDADSDDLLYECFEDHEAYQNIFNMKRFLVSGRKGAGKTAIFKKIITIKEHDVFAFGHTFSDYPWHYHDKQARIGVPDQDKYTHSWKYLISLSISKLILNNDNSLPYNDDTFEDMGKIEKFIVDSYGTKNPDVCQIFSPSKILKLKPSLEVNIHEMAKFGINPEAVPIEYLPTIIQEVNSNLIKCAVNVLNPENRYFICFDQLDLGFDPTNPDYARRLIGLILAAKDINQYAKDHGKKLFIAIFLRDDIYNRLQFEDKNKITENQMSLIEWDTSRTNYTLKKLMEKRFKATFGAGHEDVKWEDVFDEANEMPGRQSKYQHIIDRTFLRPRDIIRFSNTVLSEAKKRLVSTPTDSRLFINNDIHKAREQYSGYFFKEIDDEIHKHIPNYKRYFDVIKAIGIYRFELDNFLAEFEKQKLLMPEIVEPKDILKQLYDFSLMSFYRPGGRGFGGSEYISKHKFPDEDFDVTATRFQVHPALIEVLGLKRFEK